MNDVMPGCADVCQVYSMSGLNAGEVVGSVCTTGTCPLKSAGINCTSAGTACVCTFASCQSVDNACPEAQQEIMREVLNMQKSVRHVGFRCICEAHASVALHAQACDTVLHGMLMGVATACLRCLACLLNHPHC